MADFLTAYKRTLKSEGKYSNISSDRGNWTGGAIGSGHLIGTMYGISAPRLMKYLGRLPTVAEMQNLKLETAQLIYKHDYWDKIRGDEILIQEIANPLFDQSILAGPEEAIKEEQRATGLEDTGIMDNILLDKLNNRV